MSPTSRAVSLPSPKERRRLREALALSEDQVAEAMGVTRATVRAWETGRSSPRGRKREAYAKLLGVHEEPTTPRTEKPARPSSAATRPRPAAKGAARPPKTPTPPPATRTTPEPVEPHRPWEAAQPPEERLKPARSRAESGPQALARSHAPDAVTAAEAGTAAAANTRAGDTDAQASDPAPVAAAGSAPHATDTAGAREPGAGTSGAEASGAESSGAGTSGAEVSGAGSGEGAAPPATDPAVAAPGTRSGAPGHQDVTAARAAETAEAAEATEAAETAEAAEAEAAGLTPEEAFDALYAYAAPSLVHQTYLLTGRRRLSRESVEYAFHYAWQHWPEVAVDRDPVGWVRAAAYEYALSPWHRFRRRHRHPDSAPTEASRRALLGALLELPPPYRRTVLLYDGLGLDLPETAAETEASTPAAGNRLLHARTVIGQRVPELSDPEALQRRLAALVAEAPTATLPAARAVRTGSERRSRRLTRTVIGVTAALICITAVTAATAPTQYVPAIAPGEVVEGVPVRGGPQKLGPEDKELRDRLRSAPNPGPERLVPAAE
ncbi:sigma factor-like helix-turn-helix DNA-binding protein [Streptomyces sp. NPDC012637]|uniref:sigma factor-like helix-turn-helix DNA-binding protein n=1 Tax=Streptomyces sp. NPDC012637 TaxID=3364842 RepID=UPI0036ED915A